MSFLALRSRPAAPWNPHQVNSTSTAPGTGLQQQQGSKPRKSRDLLSRPKGGGKDVDFHGVGVDSSWHGRRARASMELCKEGKSVRGPHTYMLAFAAFWVGIKAYSFLAPSQNSTHTAADKAAFIKLLTPSPSATSTFDAHVHHLAMAAYLDVLFTILTLWPALHASTTSRQRAALQAWGYEGPVMQPSAWPLVGASFAFGVLALLPLLSSWRMPALVAPSPPLLPLQQQQQQQLQRHQPLQTQPTSSPRARSADFSQLAENRQSRLQNAEHRSGGRPSRPSMSDCWPSRLSREGAPEVLLSPQERLPSLPPVLVVGAAACIHQALTSRGNAWATYRKLFNECQLSHSAAVDFIHLTARHSRRTASEGVRPWDRSGTWLPVLSALPGICPATLSLLLPPNHPSHPCKRTSPSQLRPMPRASSSGSDSTSSSCRTLFGGDGSTTTIASGSSTSSMRSTGRRSSTGYCSNVGGGSGTKSLAQQGKRSASMELGRSGPSSSPAAKGQPPRSTNGSRDSPSAQGPQRASTDGMSDHSSIGGSGQGGGGAGGSSLWKMMAYNLVGQAY